MRGIPQDIIEEVRKRTSLLDLIGDLPKLKKTSKGYIACCPFHEDSTPSFSLNDDEGLYMCFGCGKKGNVFSYVMETKRLTFTESVKFLANRVGVIIPENGNIQYNREQFEQERKHKNLQGEILVAAVNVYRDYLLNGVGAKLGQEYLRSRAIKPEISEIFKLGFAPNAWDFITDRISGAIDGLAAKSHIENREELVKILGEIGLLKIKNDDGNVVYDALRNRIIFPIFRSDGVPIAIGGRIITQDDNTPKYINSPESLIYQKRKALYGLSQGMDAIRKQKQVFLVEGYLDVISMYQLGIANVVASCGTAVTDEHVSILKRLAGKIVVLFDADMAGKKAAAACFSLFINSGVEVAAVTLPEGEDPDSFAKTNSLQVVETYLAEKSVPAIDIYLDYLLLSNGSTTDTSLLSGKVSEEFVKTILHVQNPVEQEMFMRRACDKLGNSLESMKLLLAQTQQKAQYSKAFKLQPPPLQTQIVRSTSSYDTSDSKAKKTVTTKNTTTVATVKLEESLSEQLWRDLLVAILVKPSLAGKIFTMDAFVDGEVIINLRPPKVRDFITDVSQEIRYGVDSGESAKSEIKALLQKHSLNVDFLINAALRSAAIKDLNQENVVNETHQRIAEHVVKFRLGGINRNIREVTDENEKTALLAEKTMLAKELHRIREQT